MSYKEIDLSKKKALLFDVDGTLGDTMPAHNKSYELAFALNNVPFNLEEHKKWAPFGGEVLISKTVVEKGYGDYAHKIVSDKQKLLPICLDKFMKPNEELINLIKYHNQEKLYLVAVSNGRRKSINEILLKLGIFFHMTTIITKEDYGFAKPNPQPYLVAMEKLGLQPEEVIVFEDNEIGKESAATAGIKDIVVVNTSEF